MSTTYGCQVCGEDMDEVPGLQLCSYHEIYISHLREGWQARMNNYGRISPNFMTRDGAEAWLNALDTELLESILERLRYSEEY